MAAAGGNASAEQPQRLHRATTPRRMRDMHEVVAHGVREAVPRSTARAAFPLSSRGGGAGCRAVVLVQRHCAQPFSGSGRGSKGDGPAPYGGATHGCASARSVWICAEAAPRWHQRHSGSKPVFLLAPNIGAKQAGVDPFSHIFGARSPISCAFGGAREAQRGQKKT